MIFCYSLVKYYRESVGLSKVDLTINDGEVVGLFGINGAGKSTFLRLVAGLIEPTHGYVSIGRNSERAEFSPKRQREKIAYITEAGSFFTGLSVKEHEDFMRDFYPAFNPERYHRLVEFFGIPWRKKAREMSKGQKAKLETAIGFSKGAEILLLDEPFLGKDIFAKSDFMKSVAGLLEGETLIIATHDINEVRNFIDRAVILERGRVASDLTTDQMYDLGTTIEDELAKASGYDRSKRL